MHVCVCFCAWFRSLLLTSDPNSHQHGVRGTRRCARVRLKEVADIDDDDPSGGLASSFKTLRRLGLGFCVFLDLPDGRFHLPVFFLFLLVRLIFGVAHFLPLVVAIRRQLHLYLGTAEARRNR